jgi:hypothetical protein
MRTKFKILKILENGDLYCESRFGFITIDARTDRGQWDINEYELNIGDEFLCETFPYTPFHFARYSTIEKLNKDLK